MEYVKGAFYNYVDGILPNFDPTISRVVLL